MLAYVSESTANFARVSVGPARLRIATPPEVLREFMHSFADRHGGGQVSPFGPKGIIREKLSFPSYAGAKEQLTNG